MLENPPISITSMYYYYFFTLRDCSVRMYTCVQATVDDVNEEVQWGRAEVDGKVAMKIGSAKQVSVVTYKNSRTMYM